MGGRVARWPCGKGWSRRGKGQYKGISEGGSAALDGRAWGMQGAFGQQGLGPGQSSLAGLPKDFGFTMVQSLAAVGATYKAHPDLC